MILGDNRMVKLKDIYDLFDVVPYVYVDGKLIANNIDIDLDKKEYTNILDKEVKAITVGDGEVAIEC